MYIFKLILPRSNFFSLNVASFPLPYNPITTPFDLRWKSSCKRVFDYLCEL